MRMPGRPKRYEIKRSEMSTLEGARPLEADGDLHAPHLIDVEATHALRRMVRRGELAASRAEGMREDLREVTLMRYPHVGLLDRMWELRENLTAYDAAFVALSEALEAPLVTADARLGAATGHRAVVETLR